MDNFLNIVRNLGLVVEFMDSWLVIESHPLFSSLFRVSYRIWMGLRCRIHKGIDHR